MIYFITKNVEYYRKTISTELFPEIKVLSEKEGLDLYFNKFAKLKIKAFDIEATGLDCYLAKPILYGIGTDKHQIMFDWTIDITPIFINITKYNNILLGHNLKYDIKLVYVNTGIMIRKVYDTMIAEQRLYMRSGYRYGLDALIERYFKKQIYKTTRNEFINADLNTFKINVRHLEYLKGDLVDLFYIRKEQQIKIKKFKQDFLIYGIEFPLISEIAEAEIEGFEFDIVAWKDKLRKNIELKKELETKLDNEIRYIRDYKSVNKLYKNIDPKITLSGGKYDNPRKYNPLEDFFNKDGTVNNLDIFGENMTSKTFTGLKKKIKLNPNNIDYNSKKEVVAIFAALEEPMITAAEQFIIPKLSSKGKVIGPVNNYSLKEDLLEIYLRQNKDSLMKNFIETYIKFSKTCTAINNFGDNYLTKVHPITGKIHTIYRQCDADTGRFQSGGGKNEPDKYNSQNIPREKDYRKCFKVNNRLYSVNTCDYSGAELIVMASHAQDHRLLELSKGDMHSHMATKSWKNVFAYRANLLYTAVKDNAIIKTDEIVEEYNKLVTKAKTFLVDNTMEERTDFKGMTFENFFC